MQHCFPLHDVLDLGIRDRNLGSIEQRLECHEGFSPYGPGYIEKSNNCSLRREALTILQPDWGRYGGCCPKPITPSLSSLVYPP